MIKYRITATISAVLFGIHLIHTPLESIFPQFFVTHIYYTDITSVVGLLLSPVLHSSFQHLFGNILIFAIIGTILETRWGKYEYSLVMVLSGIASTLGQTAWYITVSKSAYVIGFSGVVFGCMGYLIWRESYSVIVKSILSLGIVVLVVQSLLSSGAVANVAHLVGAITGATIGVLFQYNKN